MADAVLKRLITRKVVDVKDEDEAIAIAKRWPAGGVVEVRPVAE